MLIRCIDFETTDKPTEDDKGAVCEVGWTDLVDRTVGRPNAMLVNPGRPIGIQAMAVHHIQNADVADAPPITDAFRKLMEGPPDYFAAFNADFEQTYFRGGDVPWIDPYKIALRLWPDAPAHNQSAVRYFLDLPLDNRDALPAHRAGPDAYVCAEILARILADNRITIEDMVRFSKGPALLPRIEFGKHRGSKWTEVPDGYLQWILGQSDMDRNVRANAKHHLKSRGLL